MPKAWLQHRSALALALFFPWFPIAPPLPSETKPTAVAAEAGVAGEPQEAGATPEEPLVLPGVVIEEVPKWSALERAGLQAGDVILSWERLPNPPANPEGESGELRTPLDWMWLEIEQAQRGVMRLMGKREGRDVTFEVQVGEWGVEVRSNHHGEAIEFGGHKAPAAETIQLWISPQSSALRSDVHAVAQFVVVGRALARERRLQEAQALLELVLENDISLKARLIATADLLEYASVGGGSRKMLDQQEAIIAALARASEKSLLLAQTYRCLGFLAWSLRDVERASKYWEIALEMDRSLAPGSLGEALDLDNLGAVADVRGDIDSAYANFSRGLDIRQALSPGTNQHARSLNNLGVVAWRKGRLDLADRHWREALDLKIRLYGEGLDAAVTLANLAALSSERRDFAAAEEYAQRALSIYEEFSPASLQIAETLTTLGIIERGRGSLSSSLAYHAKAVAAWEAIAPGSRGHATALSALAVAYNESGDADAAIKILNKAAELDQEHSSRDALCNIGIIMAQKKKYKDAANIFNQALPVQELQAPNSLSVAETLFWLGNIALEQGVYDTAITLLDRSLSIQSVYAPGSDLEAMSLHKLGQVRLKKGEAEKGVLYLEKSLDAITKHFELVGGTLETRLGYPSSYANFYYDCMKEQVNLSRQEAALLTSERYRAQAFQALLRSGVPGSGAIEGSEVVALLNENSAARDAVQRRIDAAERAGDRKETSRLLQQRETLLAQRAKTLVRYRKDFPRQAELAYPQEPTIAIVLGAGDKGTVVLSYMVASDALYLFVLADGKLVNVLRQSISRNELEREVGLVRQSPSAILMHRTANSTKGALRLFELLIAPVAEIVSMAHRILIIPDGPLHYLPWGALIRKYDEDGVQRQQYLIEWKPFHVALSASVFAEVKSRRSPASGELSASATTALDFVAFGDPAYSAVLEGHMPEAITDIRVRSVAQRGLLELDPLPWSRREVGSIAELFPAGRSRVFIGADATEEEAKAVAKSSRILHFATHAQVDDRFPLNSALALTMPEGFPANRDNGLLQVWEIFERVRLNADLVVLSGCETALGEEQGGEGLIGLTRAFQYAGARTVMASLWSVQDRATSELMIRFYKHLRAGLSKDEALRQAQIELIRGPIEVVSEKGEKILLDVSAPYYWAGFQIYGDWQ